MLHQALAVAELRPINAHSAGGGRRQLRADACWQVAGARTLPVQPDPLMRTVLGEGDRLRPERAVVA
eukprot:8850932-Lingulodinium_polyedra.AAC.1